MTITTKMNKHIRKVRCEDNNKDEQTYQKTRREDNNKDEQTYQESKV